MLLSAWERERRQRVTLADVRAEFPGRAAYDVVVSLVRKGALERIGRGLYIPSTFRSLTEPETASSSVIAAQLLEGQTYYLGGLWALTFHRLTTQSHASILDAFVTKKHRARILGSARVVFHLLRPELFRYGLQSAQIENASVRLSDPERTLLDLLDYPGVAGGLTSSIEFVQAAIPLVNERQLVAYAVEGSRLSTCQRLGVLLERQGASAKSAAPLRKKVSQTSSMLSMVDGLPRRGELNARWQVIENDEPARKGR